MGASRLIGSGTSHPPNLKQVLGPYETRTNHSSPREVSGHMVMIGAGDEGVRLRPRTPPPAVAGPAPADAPLASEGSIGTPDLIYVGTRSPFRPPKDEFSGRRPVGFDGALEIGQLGVRHSPYSRDVWILSEGDFYFVDRE